jgi:hypothetical protein
MPELYGNKFKWELRKEIRELRTKLWDELGAHRKTNGTLNYVLKENAVLREKLERMQQQAQAIISEASDDIEAAVAKKYEERWQARKRRLSAA